MEFIRKDKYLEMRPDTLDMVRRKINLDKPGEMKEAVRILDEWVKQQVHFIKKDFPPAYLEASIVYSKGSIERSKVLLDKFCTFKTLMPKYFKPYDVKNDFQHLRKSCYILAMPKQTEEYFRVSVAKFVGQISNPKMLDSIYKYVYCAYEYLKLYDYHSQTIFILDLTETDLKDAIANIDLFELKNCFVTILECYGVRVKRIHLITTSKLIDTFITFFKPILKKKIMDRINVHKSVEELHQYYSKETLPKDYGGTERSLLELQDEVLVQLSSKEFMEHVENMSEAKIDETLRPTSHFNDLYAGVYGTFRTLTLD